MNISVSAVAEIETPSVRGGERGINFLGGDKNINDNRKSWFRKPAYISIIVAMVGIVVAIIIAVLKPPSEIIVAMVGIVVAIIIAVLKPPVEISVSPIIQGSIQPGSGTQNTNQVTPPPPPPVEASLEERDKNFGGLSTQGRIEVVDAMSQLSGIYADGYVASSARVAVKEKSALELGLDDENKMQFTVTNQGHKLLEFVGGPNFKYDLIIKRIQNPNQLAELFLHLDLRAIQVAITDYNENQGLATHSLKGFLGTTAIFLLGDTSRVLETIRRMPD